PGLARAHSRHLAGRLKIAQLAVVRHVAAKNHTDVFVNDEECVRPNTVGAMNSPIEVIDKDRELDVFQTLKIACVGEFLLERLMRRIVFRRMGFARVKQKNETPLLSNSD